jgi:hypothetical protein
VPYRIAAPPEPEPPDPEAAYVAELRAVERRSRAYVVLGIALAGMVGVAAVSVPHGDRTKDTRLEREASARRAAGDIELARMGAHRAQRDFERTLRQAIGVGVAPAPELGACEITLPHPKAFHGDPFPLLVLTSTEIGRDMPSQAVAGMLFDVNRADEHLASGHIEEAALYARALTANDRLGYEVVFVTSTWRRPSVTGTDAYEPGEAAGRAYVYRFRDQRVICAADVNAKSSKSIGYAYATGPDARPSQGRARSLVEYLDDDLRQQLELAIADGITRAR